MRPEAINGRSTRLYDVDIHSPAQAPEVYESFEHVTKVKMIPRPSKWHLLMPTMGALAATIAGAGAGFMQIPGFRDNGWQMVQCSLYTLAFTEVAAVIDVVATAALSGDAKKTFTDAVSRECWCEPEGILINAATFPFAAAIGSFHMLKGVAKCCCPC